MCVCSLQVVIAWANYNQCKLYVANDDASVLYRIVKRVHIFIHIIRCIIGMYVTADSMTVFVFLSPPPMLCGWSLSLSLAWPFLTQSLLPPSPVLVLLLLVWEGRCGLVLKTCG